MIRSVVIWAGGLLVLTLVGQTGVAAQPEMQPATPQYAPQYATAPNAPAPSCPPYLTLAPHGCGQVRPLPAQTYSYGWFGAMPRQKYNTYRDYYGYRWFWW